MQTFNIQQTTKCNQQGSIYSRKLIKDLTSKAHKINFRTLKPREIDNLNCQDKTKIIKLQTFFRENDDDFDTNMLNLNQSIESIDINAKKVNSLSCRNSMHKKQYSLHNVQQNPPSIECSFLAINFNEAQTPKTCENSARLNKRIFQKRRICSRQHSKNSQQFEVDKENININIPRQNFINLHQNPDKKNFFDENTPSTSQTNKRSKKYMQNLISDKLSFFQYKNYKILLEKLHIFETLDLNYDNNNNNKQGNQNNFVDISEIRGHNFFDENSQYSSQNIKHSNNINNRSLHQFHNFKKSQRSQRIENQKILQKSFMQQKEDDDTIDFCDNKSTLNNLNILQIKQSQVQQREKQIQKLKTQNFVSKPEEKSYNILKQDQQQKRLKKIKEKSKSISYQKPDCFRNFLWKGIAENHEFQHNKNKSVINGQFHGIIGEQNDFDSFNQDDNENDEFNFYTIDNYVSDIRNKQIKVNKLDKIKRK